MNLGISNTQVSTWKRIKIQHIVAAAGIALAVSTVIGGVTLRNESSAPTAPRVTSITEPAPQPHSVLYVVGSQDEAAQLLTAAAGTGLEAGNQTAYHVMVVDSPEAESRLQTVLSDMNQVGAPHLVMVVDQR